MDILDLYTFTILTLNLLVVIKHNDDKLHIAGLVKSTTLSDQNRHGFSRKKGQSEKEDLSIF